MFPRRLQITAMTVIAAVSVAACSASGAAPATSPASAGQPTAATSAGATIGTATSSSFGTILTGPDGKTLYTYSGDSSGMSTCTGGCASSWPPVTVPPGRQPVAGAGVTGTLSTLARADGTTQVAYDGLPLYAWQGDAKPGDVTGDGVDGFSVAKAAGASAPAAPASAAPPASGGRYGY
ncbi:MAG: hypothetical protein HY262_08170 [Chloroflexi bacterium]|nr:hypothetical protein [Chloroflexota bacterium]